MQCKMNDEEIKKEYAILKKEREEERAKRGQEDIKRIRNSTLWKSLEKEERSTCSMTLK